MRFINRPLYLFGIAGILLILAGLVILLFITFLQVTYGSILGHKPLSYLGVLSILFGSQLVATGLIAQMLNVLKKDVKPYSVRQVIPGEQQDKIFDIFQRVNPEISSGEGLGLTIVRKILDKHNGKIWVESEPGIGSKFYVTLPGVKN